MRCWKGRRRAAWGILALLASALAGSVSAAGAEADRAEIARVIDASIGWFKNKDFDLLFSVFADDADFFIFHPDSRTTVRGAAAFRKFAEIFRDSERTYAGHEIRELKIDFARSGNVAWYSALLDDCSLVKGRKGCWKDCRWTGVLEKRGGRWVIAQMHFSLASDQVAAEARQAGRVAEPKPEFPSYEEMRRAVVELYQQKKHAEAAAILSRALDRYPDHVVANTYNLALMHLGMGNREEAVRALEDGHRRGVFYGKWSFQGQPWEPLGKLESYQRFLARNQALIQEAQGKAVMKLEVVTPTGYEPSRKYPLFVALHGGGENLAQFRPRWTSPRLRGEFIVAYVQSSQVASMDGYHWQEDAITAKELGEAYRQVLAKYSVDAARVLVGGFSSGGYGSLLTVFNETFRAAGFVILCPEVPADPPDEAVARAVHREIRGTLLTTEQDRRLGRQKEYVARLNAQGLDVRLVVTPNIGHWYPADLERLLDESLTHIERGAGAPPR